MEQRTYRDLNKVHDSHQWVVLRARLDGQRVVLKAARPGPLRAHGLSLLHRQHELLRNLSLPGVVKVVALEQDVQGMPALVLEDAGPQNLESWLRGAQRPSIESFLALALSIGEIVAQLHARGVIHRDLNPANVVLDGTRPTLIDFDLATSVAGLAEPTGLSRELAGSLPYIAPEQTGRTDRLVDHRSDLYSLGAIFYQMLTGAPPFRATDPVELVHAQLAAPPMPPTQVDSTIPAAISDIVLKLLAKAPEDRYQSKDSRSTLPPDPPPAPEPVSF